MLKRPLQYTDAVDRFSDFDYWIPSPSKRPHLLSTPAKSTPRSSSSVYSTPYAYSVPSDSPSNPFGFKKRAQKITLPKATSFSRHLPLRFQVVAAPDLADLPPPREPPRRDRKGRVIHYDQEGTYRIVQVPLSYTLRHLRNLILFLFNGDPTIQPSQSKPENPGYVFEAQQDIAMYAETHEPGRIKKGKTFIKSSTVQDPYYSSQSIMDLVANSEYAESDGDPFLDDEEWTWEGEEDVTLKTVWPNGADLSRGIIYRHDPTRVIHVTMCTQSIPARKGIGNKPFVFRAFGTINLDPPVPPPKSIFPSPFKKSNSKSLATLLPPSQPSQPSPSKPYHPTKPASKPLSHAAKPPVKPVSKPAAPIARAPSKSNSKHFFPPSNRSPTKPPSKPQPPPTQRVFPESHDSDADAEGSDDPDVDAPSEDGDVPRDFDGGLDPRPWNDYEAFSRFLTRASEAVGERSPTPNRSPSSSPIRPGHSDAESDASSVGGSMWHAPSSPLHLPVVTPAPALAVTRLRVERVSRRIQRLVQKGLEEEAREKVEREERERERRKEEEGREAENEETDESDGVVVAHDWDPFDVGEV